MAKPQIIILTGVAGSGKNTVAPLLAKKRKKAAVIDVDQIRHMIPHPYHRAPWSGAPGRAQRKLGYENTALLAKQFLKEKYDVIILDVLEPVGNRLLRRSLKSARITTILLNPTLSENLRRNKLRAKHLIVPEKHVRSGQRELLSQNYFDVEIDNTRLSPSATAKKINDSLT